MIVLLLSDIHANLESIEAIKEDYDQLLVLGDVIDYGPNPAECLAFVRENAHRTVRGNHDHAVAFGMDCGCSYKYKQLSIATRDFTLNVLGENDLKFLREMPLIQEFKLSGYNFYMVHASPTDNLFKYITPKTPDEEIENEIRTIDSDFILLGHSHIPMIKNVNGRTLINPGSTGQPRDGVAKVSYAILDLDEGDVRIKRASYDVSKTIEKMKNINLDKNTADVLATILIRGGDKNGEECFTN